MVCGVWDTAMSDETPHTKHETLRPMAKLALTKSGLQKQRNDLKLYQKLLPSLDMKRMQLTAELNTARVECVRIAQDADQLDRHIAEQLPMLADDEIPLSGLIRIKDVKLGQENVVGVTLSVLEEVQFAVFTYSMLAKPHWVDTLVEKLQHTATLRIEVQVAAERVRELERAVRRTTQRVNLFGKILIPTAQRNIQRIQIFLGDAERSAVVRSKLVKRITHKKRQAFIMGGALT